MKAEQVGLRFSGNMLSDIEGYELFVDYIVTKGGRLVSGKAGNFKQLIIKNNCYQLSQTVPLSKAAQTTITSQEFDAILLLTEPSKTIKVEVVGSDF